MDVPFTCLSTYICKSNILTTLLRTIQRQLTHQLSPDAEASASSLCHVFWQANMCLNHKQWPDRLTAFRTNSVSLITHQTKRQSCIPTLTNNAQRELLGNTSPIHTFSGAAWNAAQAVLPPACLSKSPIQGHENCPNAQSTVQADSQADQESEVLCPKLMHDDYFDEVIIGTST